MEVPPTRRGPSRGTRLLRYALGCLVAGAATVAVVLLVLDDGEEQVTLPPVAQTDLASAASTAGCTVGLRDDERPEEPPSDGTSTATPAEPGVYDEAPPRDALVAALRDGKVIVSHHLELPGDVRTELEALQASVPEGVLLVPNGEMAVELAASAWQRVVLCPDAEGAATDAIRLFQGRFLGARP